MDRASRSRRAAPPAVGSDPRDVDEVRERRVRAAARGRAAARDRGGSRGRTPPRPAALELLQHRVGERLVDRDVALLPGASQVELRLVLAGPRGSAGGTTARDWRRRCSTGRRRAASCATSRSRYGEPSRAVSSTAPSAATARSSSEIALAIHVTSWCETSRAQRGHEPAGAAPRDPLAGRVARVPDRPAVGDDDQPAPAHRTPCREASATARSLTKRSREPRPSRRRRSRLVRDRADDRDPEAALGRARRRRRARGVGSKPLPSSATSIDQPVLPQLEADRRRDRRRPRRRGGRSSSTPP